MTRSAAVLTLLALAIAGGQLGFGAEAKAIAEAGNGRGAVACNTCHGPHGEGLSAGGYPRLAGTPAPYLEEQLDQFASGARESAVMRPIAVALSPAERRALSIYFSGLKARVQPAPAGSSREPANPADLQSADVALGAALAERGRWSVGLPACSACHGPDGEGVGSRFPPLAGQPAAYLANQLHAWQAKRRAPGPLGLMALVSGKLEDPEIAAVAAYYALPDRNRVPSSAPLPTPHGALPGAPTALPPNGATVGRLAPGTARFVPPAPGTEPSGELGKMIRQGERIFLRPDRYAASFVGNRLRCSSCHLDAGRRADSAPLWAAYVLYPAYRSKNRRVNTFQERLQGCFRFSMNGKAPPLGSPILVALETYSYWLARGAPTGVRLEGQGYPKLARPPRPPDYTRGAAVYATHCALCHGGNGAGQTSATGEPVFPALWGSGSFNWGAGMESFEEAAGFIEANMPLALGGTLDIQQAWDVALYIDGHERPQDPRFTGSIAETRARFHDSPYSMYGRRVNGRALGQGS